MDEADEWLRNQAARSNVLAVGEAGLDKLTDTPWALQLIAFQRCVEISEAFQKPLLIHCVRSFAEIIALKKKWNPVQPWIFHGFDKNIQTAQMLLKAGCFLSFGAGILQSKHPAAGVLRQINADRFFLETDDTLIPIENIYQCASMVRAVSLEDLSIQLDDNFFKVFKQRFSAPIQ